MRARMARAGSAGVVATTPAVVAAPKGAGGRGVAAEADPTAEAAAPRRNASAGGSAVLAVAALVAAPLGAGWFSTSHNTGLMKCWIQHYPIIPYINHILAIH